MSDSRRIAKQVSLLTWATGENYGSTLQCFALNAVISQSYSCSVVFYEKLCDTLLKKLCKNPIKTLNLAFNNRYKKLLGTMPVAYEIQKERHERFVKFRSDFFTMTRKFSSTEELSSLHDKFDAFVCGSDQIWNPFVFDSAFFFDFVHDNSKKIAYAPSFGTENIEKSENAKKIIPLVKEFAFLSCREESGAAWLSEKTRRKVSCVLDPTLLLKKDEWNKIANDNYPRPEHYIFCYFLGHNEAYLKSVFEFANERNLKIVLIPIYKKDFSRSCVVLKDVGPCEFVSLVKNADYVCTDSFHGCCFSVLFEKQFAPFLRFSKNDKKSQNARVTSFLKKTGLGHLIYSKENELKKILSAEIDYKYVNSVLESEREKSLSYLHNALNLATGGSDE